MTDYGLIIKNNNSEIQIDSTYRNLSLQDYGSDLLNAGGKNTKDITITSSSDIPIILIQPDTGKYARVDTFLTSGSNIIGFRLVAGYGVSTTIAWRSYRQTTLSGSGIYGLRVFDTSSNIVFDSDRAYFKIRQVDSISPITYPNITTIPHSEIVSPYYLLSTWNFARIPRAPPGSGADIYLIGIAPNTTTSVDIAWFHVDVVGGAGGFTQNPTCVLATCMP